VAHSINLFWHNLWCYQGITSRFASGYATFGKNFAKKVFMKLATGVLKFITINVMNLVTLLWATHVQLKANLDIQFQCPISD